MELENLCISCFRDTCGEEVCMYCGEIQKKTPKEIFHLYPHTILKDRYIIGKVLGFGGFGITYKAWDLKLNAIVAIKEFFPAGLANRVPRTSEVIRYPGEKGERFEAGKRKFLREARSTAKFSENINIVKVFDFFEANHTAYFVMEFLDGITLKDYLIKNGGKLSVEESVSIILQVADGLIDIHKAGIIHRDISPDNIFLTKNNRVKIIDFGAARFSSTEQESTYSIELKQGFAPPEQYRSKSKQGPFTDVYATGAVLYKMLTGEIPEESVDRQIEDELKRPSELVENLPQYLDKAIMKALSLQSELRFQNMQQFKDAVTGRKAALLPEEELKRKQRRRKIGFISISATLIICIFAAALFKVFTAPVNINQYVKNDASLTVWVPVPDDAEQSQNIQERYNQIFQEYVAYAKSDDGKKALEADLEIHVEYLPSKSYVASLEKASQSGTLPDIYYCSTDLPESFIQATAADLSWLDRKLLDSNYVFHGNLPFTNRLPVSLDCWILFTNKKIDEQGKISGLQDAESLLQMDCSALKKTCQKPLTIREQEIDLVAQSISGDAEKTDALVRESKTDSTNATALEQFAAGTSASYLGRLSELETVKNAGIIYYSMSQPNFLSEKYYFYADTWAVSNQLQNDQKYAAMFALAYLLSDSAQETLYIDQNTYLPLNDRILTVYCEKTHKNDQLNLSKERILEGRFETKQNSKGE